MTDAGWVAGKNIIQQGYYWYRDFEQDTQPDVIMVEGDGSELEPFIVRWECADDELVENMTGQFLGPISPEAYHQGRVAGLREAADFVEVQELADPSGLSRKEQLRIYDILIKVEAGIRNLAIERQAQGEQP